MIALASVLLVLSLTANWIQRELFNTDEVANTTDEILRMSSQLVGAVVTTAGSYISGSEPQFHGTP